MCGIVGATSSRNVVPMLIEGIRRLEYRGYDSTGIAVVNGGASPHLERLVSTARVAATEARWVKTPTYTMVRVEGTGNVGTAAFKARYPDETVWWVIIMYELRGDLVAKNTAFFAPLFEAPEWRKQYAQRAETTKP